MSDSSNPFAATEQPEQPASRRLIAAWAVAGLAIVTAVVFAVMWSHQRSIHQKDAKTARAELDDLASKLARVSLLNQTNLDFLARLTNQVAELEREKALAGQVAHSLEDEMRQQLESKDVTISKLQGKLTVSIVDRIMFDSGEAILKPDGGAVMQKIADLLTAHPELKIHVIGHTDNVPIRATAQSRFASNWELSAARALAAVHFLVERAGVDPRRLGAVGYGEFRPIADNSTAEGRAKNRRIAITILPDELAVADDVPLANATVTTNTPPAIEPGVPAN
jgi:chemotaxis protein MotB